MMRRRLKVIALAPFEIAMQVCIGAWKGFELAVENIRDAWAEVEDHGSW